MVVTDAGAPARPGDIYRRAWDRYLAEGVGSGPPTVPAADPAGRAQQRRIGTLGPLPGRPPGRGPGARGGLPRAAAPRTRPQVVQASAFGSVLPAVWSFMLAARARGLGTAWTTIHLFHEREAAEVLGIPYDEVAQVALIPLAHTIGTDFQPGPRRPLEGFARWDGW